MQSFPVLVLLGGIVCSFHGVFSTELSGLGTIFSINSHTAEEGVQGLKFYFGSLGFLRGIQVKVDGEWSSRYGASGGNENAINLYDNESIIKISGQRGICIRFIVVETDMGRTFKFGKPVGGYFEASPPNEDMELSGIQGLYGPICIKTLAFTWSPIAYDDSTPSNSTGPPK